MRKSLKLVTFFFIYLMVVMGAVVSFAFAQQDQKKLEAVQQKQEAKPVGVKVPIEQGSEAIIDPSSIKTFEEFIKAWRRRVAAGQGSKMVLTLYDELKKKPIPEAFEECFQQAREEGDQWGEAVCLVDAYETIDVPPLTIKQAEEWTRRGGELGKILLGHEAGVYELSMNNIGVLFLAQRNYQKARPFFEESLSIRERLFGPKHLLVVQSLLSLADVMEGLGEYKETHLLFKRALDTSEETLSSDHPEIARVLNEFGVFLYRQSDYEGARPLYEQALEIRRKLYGTEHPDVAISLNNLALLLEEQGDYARAQSLYEQALDIRKKVLDPQHPKVAITLNCLAALHYAKGDYARARPLYEQALEIQKEVYGVEHPNVAASLNNLAALLRAQGDYARARPLYEQALEIYERVIGPENLYVASLLNNLGSLHTAKRDYDQARPLYERALEIRRKIQGLDHLHAAHILNNLSHLFYKQRDYERARRLNEQVLDIQKRRLGLDHPHVANTLSSLAVLYTKQGNYDRARSLHERVLEIRRKVYGTEHPSVAESLHNLGELSSYEDDNVSACSLFLKEAVVINRHLASIFTTLSWAEQRIFLNLYLPKQRASLFSACKGGELFPPAYKEVLARKGLLINSLHRQTVVNRLARENPKNKTKLDQLNSLRRKIAGWYHKAGTLPFIEWEKKNIELTDEKEDLERELAQALPRDALKDVMAEINLPEFQRLLQSDEVLLDLYRYRFAEHGFFVEERYAAVIVAPQSPPQLIDLGNAKEINALIDIWRSAVLKGQSGTKMWKVISTRLWQPLFEALPKDSRKVWLSPDAELSRIPWNLLAETRKESQRILISQIGSPREFVRLHKASPVESPALSILLLGGLDFGGKKRLSDEEPVIIPDQDERGKIRFGALAHTKAEVEAIGKLAREYKLRTIPLTGKDGLKDTIVSKLSGATFAHLATHGFFSKSHSTAERKHLDIDQFTMESSKIQSGRNPLIESGIALSEANVRDPITMEAKGLLTAEELVGINLQNTELVTLSACNTGRGKELTGQGVMGLRAAIMAAGARSILMSLWKVHDEATMILMKAFYTNLWEKKMTKIEALKQAQKTVRQNPRFEAPIYWAAWVLEGQTW